MRRMALHANLITQTPSANMEYSKFSLGRGWGSWEVARWVCGARVVNESGGVEERTGGPPYTCGAWGRKVVVREWDGAATVML